MTCLKPHSSAQHLVSFWDHLKSGHAVRPHGVWEEDGGTTSLRTTLFPGSLTRGLRPPPEVTRTVVKRARWPLGTSHRPRGPRLLLPSAEPGSALSGAQSLRAASVLFPLPHRCPGRTHHATHFSEHQATTAGRGQPRILELTFWANTPREQRTHVSGNPGRVRQEGGNRGTRTADHAAGGVGHGA